MTSGDKALYWLSDRGSTSAAQFQRMVSRAAFGSADNRLKGLRWMLRKSLVWDGHAEGLADGRLLVTPPLAYRSESGESLLAGARSAGLAEAAEQSGLRVDMEEQVTSASRWRLSGSDDAINDFALSVGLPIVECPGLKILRALPPVTVLLENARQAGRPSEAVERWQPGKSSPMWSPSTDEVEGYFRQTVGHRNSYFWRTKEGEWRSLRSDDERAAARWSLCKPRVDHETSEGVCRLSVSPRTPMPDLVERALRSASGREPSRESDRRVYTGVPHSWAVEVARILETPLREAKHG